MTTITKTTSLKKNWTSIGFPAFSLFSIFLLALSCGTKKTSNTDPSGNNPTTVIIRDTIIIRDTVETAGKQVYVSAEKMNVLYIGVDNPISISAVGVAANDLQVKGSGGGIQLKRVGNGRYIANVSSPGEGNLRVTGDGVFYSWPYRVKRIPDPVARLSKSSGGSMGNGEFKAQGGVGAFLDNFDFDARCQITGFNLVYVAKRQDPIPSNNVGARYTDKSRRLVNRAKPGDLYYFDNVRAKCPGDAATRKINTMVFTIR
jgi:hypothetical protein